MRSNPVRIEDAALVARVDEALDETFRRRRLAAPRRPREEQRTGNGAYGDRASLLVFAEQQVAPPAARRGRAQIVVEDLPDQLLDAEVRGVAQHEVGALLQCRQCVRDRGAQLRLGEEDMVVLGVADGDRIVR